LTQGGYEKLIGIHHLSLFQAKREETASSTTIQHTENQPEAKGYDPQQALKQMAPYMYVCVEIQFLFQNASTC